VSQVHRLSEGFDLAGGRAAVAVHVGQFAQQIHDFNPGVDSRGVFWTTRISENLTSINPERGTARFHATHMAIPDFRHFPNSLGLVY
jgi:hypothetical protein